MLKEKRLRDARYLVWVRSLPCVACQIDTGGSDPDHVCEPMRGAKGVKAPDNQVLPLCHHCHTTRHNVGVKTFYKENTGHTVEECVDMAKEIYESYTDGKSHDAVKWVLFGWRR